MLKEKSARSELRTILMTRGLRAPEVLVILLALGFPTNASIQGRPASVKSSSSFTASQSNSSPLTDRQVKARVEKILRQMTLKEEIGQLTQVGQYVKDTVPVEERIRKGEVGSVLWLSDPAAINRLQHVAVEESRRHIPLLFGLDVISGFKTIFPAPLAMASSWDTALVEQEQTMTAREAYAAGIRWTFSPMVDIARDPR